jgi:hypothetical protein
MTTKNMGLYNVPQITSLEIPAIVAAFRNNKKVCAFMGPPGCGKTSAVIYATQEWAKEIGKEFNPNPNSNGLPHLKQMPNGTQITEYTPTELFPTEGCGVVFLDEFPNGRTQVQNALQQMVLEHRIGNKIISPDIHFIIAGNRPSDNCGTFYIPSALRNRIGWYEVNRPKVEDWLELMRDIGKPINQRMEGWILSIGAKYFDNFDPKAEQYAFGTTRSIEMASQMMADIDLSHPENYHMLKNLVGGLIGADAGSDMVAFLKLTEKVDIKGLFDKPKEIHKYEDRMDMMYSIGVALIEKVSEEPKLCEKWLDILGETNRMEHGVFMLKSVMNRWGGSKTLERINKCANAKTVTQKYAKLLAKAI